MDCSVLLLLGIYTPLKRVCIAHNNCMSCPSIGNSHLHCSLIYFWVPSSCFCIVISLLWGWNNPAQRCLPVGEAALSTPEAVVASRTDWQTALMCNRRRPAATSSRRASFSALASANSFVILHRAQQHHADASAMPHCCVRQLQFSGIFVALGFVGNGVITVMINSPWQADDDADNQSGDNRVCDSAHTSISLTVPPAFEFKNQAVSLMLELTITSARQWSPDIAATVDCLTDITINHR